jgi:hypothetical protein
MSIGSSNLLSTAIGLGLAAFTGGASLAITQGLSQLATQAFSQALTQVAGQFLSQAVQQGVSQMFQSAFNEALSGVTGLAKDAISGANDGGSAGREAIDAANHQGTNGAYTGDADRAQQDITDAMIRLFNNVGAGDEGSVTKKGGESWLMVLAKAMGQMLGKKIEKMQGIQDQMNAHVDDKKGNKFAELNSEFSAASQEVNMLSNTINTAIKSLGEAMSTLSRKSG